MNRLLVAFVATVVALALVLPTSAAFAGGKVGKSCTYKGKQLWGKVKIVEHFPDITVKIVEHFPDLKVKQVEHFPDSCGKWKFVEHHPDIKVKFVAHHADIKIKYVEHFPGIP